MQRLVVEWVRTVLTQDADPDGWTANFFPVQRLIKGGPVLQHILHSRPRRLIRQQRDRRVVVSLLSISGKERVSLFSTKRIGPVLVRQIEGVGGRDDGALQVGAVVRMSQKKVATG